MNKKRIAALVLSAAMATSGLGISAQAKTLSEQVKTPKTVLVGDCNQERLTCPIWFPCSCIC